ncbi:MAG: hypothetical protein IJ106_01730 [Parasporobacterium sp.]|nr:hypothetical protein [Parasporobacterium sp.]
MTLSQLYPGDKILDPYSSLTFLVAGRSPYGDGILLITDRVIGVGAMDAPEPDSEIENHRITGDNDYLLSNLSQWLNSDQADWFSPSHPADTPPSEEYLSIRPTLYDPIGHNAYAHKPGFLTRFRKEFTDRICSSKIPCADPSDSSIRCFETRVFCPSAAELGLRTGVVNEGEELPLFRDFRMRYASPSEECLMESEWFPAYFRSHRMFWYWLRTPNTKARGFYAVSHFVNPFMYKFACSPWMGIRPMLSLREDTPVAPSEGAFGICRFVY